VLRWGVWEGDGEGVRFHVGPNPIKTKRIIPKSPFTSTLETETGFASWILLAVVKNTDSAGAPWMNDEQVCDQAVMRDYTSYRVFSQSNAPLHGQGVGRKCMLRKEEFPFLKQRHFLGPTRQFKGARRRDDALERSRASSGFGNHAMPTSTARAVSHGTCR
jgi:hypothetical protein